MRMREHRWFIVALVCALAVLAISFPGPMFATLAHAAASGAASTAPQPVPEDPLGRSTPYGTVIGFLRAADKGDYQAASRYLEGTQPAKEREALARDLRTVLNRGLRVGLEDLSRVPEGRLDDGLSVYLEKVGTAIYGSNSLNIVLRRTVKPDAPPIWFFSSETLRGVAAAAKELEPAWGEKLWPESFREIDFLSYPLFRLINLLVGIPLALGVAWLFARWLLVLLRPLFLRRSKQHGESALARIKWPEVLLIFAVLLRIPAAIGGTVAGRILFDSLSIVLTIVAVSWLLIRMTKLVSRSKVLRLRRSGVPSRIAAVELSGWLIVCVCFVAGLFLILTSLGFEVTAAVAGLGVGGIAIAFAAQKTIENLFGTITVITDEAIHVGDYCQAGAIEGRVESIGLRSTRIRTPDRTVVSIPNGQLAATSIGNLARRDKFLFRHNIRLRYDTTSEQLRHVLAEIRKMMSEHSALEPETIRTRLIRFGEKSLELEAFAYVLTRESTVFLEIQEDLLLRIMNIIEASGTSVAPQP